MVFNRIGQKSREANFGQKMEIIKDHRKWEVTHTFTNENCPYLFYPLNYHGCELLPEDKNECTRENCQYITSVIIETKE